MLLSVASERSRCLFGTQSQVPLSVYLICHLFWQNSRLSERNESHWDEMKRNPFTQMRPSDDTHKYPHLEDLGHCRLRRRSVLHSIVEFIVAFVVAPLRCRESIWQKSLHSIVTWQTTNGVDAQTLACAKRRGCVRRLSGSRIIYFGHM